MTIQKYTAQDADLLMALLKTEGEEWACYHAPSVADKYKTALEKSITYIACADDMIVGYCRALEDYGFYIYVCDLLVDKRYRGKGIGRKLMEAVCEESPELTGYVMSDADPYYEKLGYLREGSVFEMTPPVSNPGKGEE